MRRFPQTVRELLLIYSKKRVSSGAAALSYCLTLAVFPFLICLGAMLASLKAAPEELLGSVGQGALTVLQEYQRSISGRETGMLLISGITVMISSSSAAFRTILNIFASIQGASRFRGLGGLLASFFMSILFLAAMYLSCMIIVSGQWLTNELAGITGLRIVGKSWSWMRFLVLFFLLYLTIVCIYEISAPRGGAPIPRATGAALASALLVVVSIFFSAMIERSTRYTLIYGSLASIIVLMIWFYLCGIILIMGNVLNLVMHRNAAK